MLPILKLYSSNERVFKINFDGITHEESLKEINSCNSVNWILGHMVFIRNTILSQLALPPLADEKMKEVYGRGVVKPDMNKAMNLDTLKKMYEDSQPFIMQGLERVKEEALLEQLTFMGFHEAYHLGQIGLLRKMLGKEGAIK
jgi:uncharacterized damage-inducible protein DinB